MPFSTVAPPNKKKANRIITDLSNISQNGKKKKTPQKTTSPHAHKFNCAGIQLYRSGNTTDLAATVTLCLCLSVSKSFHTLSCTT